MIRACWVSCGSTNKSDKDSNCLVFSGGYTQKKIPSKFISGRCSNKLEKHLHPGGKRKRIVSIDLFVSLITFIFFVFSRCNWNVMQQTRSLHFFHLFTNVCEGFMVPLDLWIHISIRTTHHVDTFESSNPQLFYESVHFSSEIHLNRQRATESCFPSISSIKIITTWTFLSHSVFLNKW